MTADVIRPAAFACEPLSGRRQKLFDKIVARVRIHLPRDGQTTGCWEYLGADSGKPGRGRDKGRGHSYGRMCVDGATNGGSHRHVGHLPWADSATETDRPLWQVLDPQVLQFRPFTDGHA